MTRVHWFAAVLALVLLLLMLWGALEPRPLPLGVHTIRADDIMLRQVHALGATYFVQVFSWHDIQPSPARWDWEYTDWLVRAADYYNLAVVARLDKPPAWAVENASAVSSPPRNTADYVEFVRRVAERYRGKIQAYIIWNEPNLAIEWGDQPPDARAYTALLRAASATLRVTDPHARVLAAGLAPTNENSAQAQDDRVFLRAMYAAGAHGTFDALAVHPYAFALSPDAPREMNEHLNFARIQDWREIMVENGDAQTRLWITEFGYPTEQPPGFQDRVVTDAQQAEFLVRAYTGTRQEFPFVESFTVWNLARDVPATDEQAGYTIVRPDGTRKPAYDAIRTLNPPTLLSGIIETAHSLRLPIPAVNVLARDAVVHLGDSELPAPFVPLYKNQNPAEEWKGEFYLQSMDLVGARSVREWSVTVELMQVNDYDSRIWVNDVPLVPAYLPVQDFTSKWVTARFKIPLGTLREGYNTLSLQAGKLTPAFQQKGFTWDEFQFRNIRVIPP